ncbi:Fic/DOC family protein [Thorsellia anophelis DSM 18579]|uniref:Fic/DOC family protein n=2 Tax=Thorsellia anophelis TaxID=336804 RepID=A0A1H9ZA46_9GAMM|nr:Fic/DOC family protein [Thorsellia anophelis DSM 18579]
MDNLVQFINDDELCGCDPLVKMAIIHHQFESIHPFYDGNGRTGRIINILYLVIKDLLNLPILYLSRFIIMHKSEYYHHLQAVRDTGDWEPWLLFILDGVIDTAQNTISLITGMKDLMIKIKSEIRQQLPHIYSQDLLNNLFNHPYTKIEYLVEELGVTRATASKYLEQLTEHGFLSKHKIGCANYYINQPLYDLLLAHS